MRVAGIGFRKGASAASLRAALAPMGAFQRLATAEEKLAEPGLQSLAKEMGVGLHGVSRAEMAAQGIAGSARVTALYGTGSVAEAAALAVAGPGARLVIGRSRGPDGMAVAALAEGAA